MISEYPCRGDSSLRLRTTSVATLASIRLNRRFPLAECHQRFVSRVGNLGLGGWFIRTPEPPPLGTLIQLWLPHHCLFFQFNAIHRVLDHEFYFILRRSASTLRLSP